MAVIGANERNAWHVDGTTVDLVRRRGSPRPVWLRAEPQDLRFDLARSACLVVDMQNDFCAKGGWLDSIGVDVEPARRPIEPLSKLLPALRRLQVPIIWLNWGNRPDRANIPPGVLHVYNPDGASTGLGDPLPGSGSRVLERGSWGAAIVEDLEVSPEDVHVAKYRMSGFVDTELDSVLRNLDVSTLLFAGVNADQCVFSTLIDAAGLGYDSILLSDCSATTSPEFCYDATLYNVRQCFGFTADSADLLAAMALRADQASGPLLDARQVPDPSSRTTRPPPRGVELHDTASAWRISPGDTVKLAPLRYPSGAYDASVFLEIWEPGGSQPPNSHPDSVETFFFLAGEGVAHCDDEVVPVRAGQLIVLPSGSLHWIKNTGTEKLLAITTMTPDAGFAALVTSGVEEMLEPADLALFSRFRPAD